MLVSTDGGGGRDCDDSFGGCGGADGARTESACSGLASEFDFGGSFGLDSDDDAWTSGTTVSATSSMGLAGSDDSDDTPLRFVVVVFLGLFSSDILKQLQERI